MAKGKREKDLIEKVSDASLTEALARYDRSRTQARIAGIKRDLTLNSLSSAIGRADFEKHLAKLLADTEKEQHAAAMELARAYHEYQTLLCKVIRTKPCRLARAPTRLRVRPWTVEGYRSAHLMHMMGGVPECVLVEGGFTDFMGVREFDQSLIDQVEILPDAETASTVRVKIDGENQTSTLSATWGLEITDTFLADHCKLELGGITNMSGVVSISAGGMVRLSADTFLTIYRLPNVALADVNPAIHPADHMFFSSHFASNERVDQVPGLHAIDVLEDQLFAQFLSNGLFVTVPEVSYSLVEPNYTLQAGDKIFLGFWFEFEAVQSYLAFHLNGVGTHWMSPYIAHYKWQ